MLKQKNVITGVILNMPAFPLILIIILKPNALVSFLYS